jgi:hypothetical protein
MRVSLRRMGNETELTMQNLVDRPCYASWPSLRLFVFADLELAVQRRVCCDEKTKKGQFRWWAVSTRSLEGWELTVFLDMFR